ncbi:hypothetical protein AAFF_G00083840 [Aldrovandia affinis]|uniref:Mutator-like transposase domain-containing protein n=1 Tax=Aldrovandia affinis TaxID=143900 RepID=A0AAD7RWY4_9TELE|nr:hypothetical protein AAFF_G00083840 [Aldrovandia affinis]
MEAKTRVKLSKKRQLQLHLAREKKRKSGETAPEVDVEENFDLPQSASKRKLSLDLAYSKEHAAAATQDWLLVHVGQLNGLIANLLSPDCGETKLKVEIGQGNQGFSSNLVLGCGAGECAYCRSIFSSPRLQDESMAYDINVRMVLLAHELGMGYAALKKISKVLGIPGIAHKTYVKHNKTVSAVEINRGLESLHKTREVVRQAYADTDPDVAELLQEDPDAVINISWASKN